MDDKVFERLKEVAMNEFGVTLKKVEYSETSEKIRKELKDELILKRNIENLRHRGATKEEIQAEIEFRRETLTVDSTKCFGYLTNELENALKYWDKF